MPLQKQQVNVNFSQGLDTKSDPWQVPIGNFLALENSVFTKNGLLQKRNGFASVGTISDSSVSAISTFKGELTAVGNNIYAYNQSSQSFLNKGRFQQVDLSAMPLVKNSINQTQADSATSTNGLVCVAYTETTGSATSYKYQILDNETGQVVLGPADITPNAGAVSGSPRVFLLGPYFILVFTVTVGGANQLQYVAISESDLTVSTAVTISASYTAASTVAFDCLVVGNIMSICWNKSGAAGVVGKTLTSTLILSSEVAIDSNVATHMSLSSDGQVLYVVFYSSATQNGYVQGVSPITLSAVPGFTVQQWAATVSIANITSSAQNGVCTIIWELNNNYSYTAIATNNLWKRTCTAAGVLGAAPTSPFIRSLGLASKSFIYNGTIYMLAAYSSTYQSGYYLIDINGNEIAKLAYQNGGGYLTLGLPAVTLIDNRIEVAYRFKNLVQAVNKDTNVPSGTQTAGVYSQTGINLAKISIGGGDISTAEIGNNLNLSGGFLWSYDGYSATENGFFVYPENVTATWSATGGNMAAQPLSGGGNTNVYYYQVTYEWTDNQGNAFISAPSIPVAVTTTGSGVIGSVALNIPTLRLTYKTNVKICIYRWSLGQQNYYQVTSISSPTLNNTAVDSVAFTDTLADATILGNSLLYTTGGAVENISAPAIKALTLFDNRLFAIDAENQNTLWYSKPVIQATPVEMSDLFTIYVTPTQSAQGPTGPVTAIAPMDDKLIIFKKDAIYYVNGTGPDSAGQNAQYSEPIFVTSTIGSTNQNSIVFIPTGLMFQSDKGIWLLGRDLSTTYIGAPVESFTEVAQVVTALNIPGTNQVRFTMDSGVTLMYDYFFQQWGSFTGIPAISSTLYEGFHTNLNKTVAVASGGAETVTLRVLQERPGTYLDNNNPVLMKFKTSWFALAGIQGFQRAYFFYLLGRYISPHKLVVEVAYDFNSANIQQTVISPTNYNPAFGGNPVYGSSSSWGGETSVEKWRIMLQQQKCDSVQFTVTEQYDASLGVPAGQGLTLSGMNVIIGIKRGFGTIPQINTAG